MLNSTVVPHPGVAVLVMEVAVMEVVVAVMAPCPHPNVSWLPLVPLHLLLCLLLCLLLPLLQLLRCRPRLQQSSSNQNPQVAPAAAAQPPPRAEAAPAAAASADNYPQQPLGEFDELLGAGPGDWRSKTLFNSGRALITQADLQIRHRHLNLHRLHAAKLL